MLTSAIVKNPKWLLVLLEWNTVLVASSGRWTSVFSKGGKSLDQLGMAEADSPAAD